MSVNVATVSEFGSMTSDGAGLLIHAFSDGRNRVVAASGELDLAGRSVLFLAATAGDEPRVVVDLSGVTFMDCAGYGSIVASRLALREMDRTLIVRRPRGQPAHLLHLITEHGRSHAQSVLSSAQ